MKALIIALVMSNVLTAPYGQTETWIYGSKYETTAETYWVNPQTGALHFMYEEMHERR